MTFDDLIEAVQHAAAALTMSAPDVSSGKGKAFEAWALLVVGRHLSDMHLAIGAVGCDGRPVDTFIVRGGPGGMPRATDDPTRTPSHLMIVDAEFGYERELHLGLRHRSTHGSTHELDLCALPLSAAQGCRDDGGGPYQGPLLMAAELKAYDAEHKLSLVFGRALLGVMVDLQPWRTIHRIYLDLGQRCLPAWSPLGRRTPMHIVTTTGVYENTRSLMREHGGSVVENLVPKTGTEWRRLRQLAEDVLV